MSEICLKIFQWWWGVGSEGTDETSSAMHLLIITEAG